MQWQVWTAFGIMLGTVADLAFLKVADIPGNGIVSAFFVRSRRSFADFSTLRPDSTGDSCWVLRHYLLYLSWHKASIAGTGSRISLTRLRSLLLP